ncbi:hypothetical protein, partial [Paraburkholderia atlantica]|uniref:hypothetical protein n=1 Tax=Paraburkholderia atlantica TaxID=2654982 RepID=UPI00187BA620
PPAFNLSQDQTLQFKPVTVFGSVMNRSLTQRTDDDQSVFRQINLPLILCEASDTFALQQTPENPPPHSASSAHTYRLLVFKDRSAKPAAPEPPLPGTASFASLRLQQRNEIMKNFRRIVNRFLSLA